MKINLSAIYGALLVAVSAFSPAHADSFPGKPVRIIVPYPAGGSADMLARLIAPKLTAKWGVPVVIENKPGGSTTIGVNTIARAAPDGLTFGVVANVFTVNASLMPKLPYDTAQDLTPVAQLSFAPNILVAYPQGKIHSMADLLRIAKKGAGSVTSGSIGNGTASHLALEKMKSLAGIDVQHIPFQGSAPGITAVMGGHTDLMMSNLPDVLQYIKAGKLLALSVGSATRVPELPNVPTFIESGFPGFTSGAWYGTIVPVGTPKAIVARLSTDLTSVVKDPEVQEKIKGLGLQPVVSTQADFAKLVQAQIKDNGDIVRRAGIKPD
ncbi:tripartite tricarboxylate transporter substrate binding protein [Cupriavidus pauculus]|uniref:Bug family tripartite tricarboxylate transporter substrate binding protein n=1 Tax=Cupriavidus pauculus TaxID=82633 RepID=UPI001EE3618E|nr:tripartite tricarboxylate transporter substrate binding protein [Cupriavidus pauculus]GJG94315.1 tripartite tricarboxylate transporter substrate binding protein [Cupriavidus pauculus]